MNPDSRWRQAYTPSDSFGAEVSRGNVKGAYIFSSHGHLTTAGAVTDALVQNQNGTVLHVPQSIQMELISTSGNDSAAGTGVRTVVVEYLDGNLDLTIEVVTLNGLTPVSTVATDIRWVQGVYMVTAGSGGAAIGDISIQSVGGAITYAQISAGERASESSFKRVPRGKKFFISSLYAGSSSGTAAASALVHLVSTQIDGLDQQETGLFYNLAGTAIQDSSATMSLPVPFPLTEGHIVGFTVTVDKTALVTVGFMGWIENAGSQ